MLCSSSSSSRRIFRWVALLLAEAMAGSTDCLNLWFRQESLGGHSLDDCGEFMASPSSNPSDPTSLICTACDCHRNFHRRLHHHSPPPPPPPPPQQLEQKVDDDERESPSAANGDTDENNINNNNSSPHMLMALSAGIFAPQPVNSAAAAQIQSTGGVAGPPVSARSRAAGRGSGVGSSRRRGCWSC